MRNKVLKTKQVRILCGNVIETLATSAPDIVYTIHLLAKKLSNVLRTDDHLTYSLSLT